MSARIPEPHELADAYYAEQEERRLAVLRETCCGECGNYVDAPEVWVKVKFGWCSYCGEFTEYDERPIEFECEGYER